MTTLPAIVDQYQAHLTEVGKSPHTVKAYVRDVHQFVKWWEQTSGDSFGPSLVDSRDVQDYRASQLQKQLKPATINRRLKAVQHFFKWAVRSQEAQFNPFDILEQVYIKEQRDTAPKWLSRHEQLALLRAVRKADSLRDLSIIQTLLGTGLRVSELTALTFDDVELSERKGSVQVRAGKGMKARTIPLDQRTRQALDAYLSEREAETNHNIFLGQRGPLSDRAIEKLVEKYAYQAQLDHCTPHTLRHTYAKNLLDSEEKPGLEVVATLMGHASLETTRIYTLPSQRDLERAVRSAAGEL